MISAVDGSRSCGGKITTDPILDNPGGHDGGKEGSISAHGPYAGKTGERIEFRWSTTHIDFRYLLPGYDHTISSGPNYKKAELVIAWNFGDSEVENSYLYNDKFDYSLNGSYLCIKSLGDSLTGLDLSKDKFRASHIYKKPGIYNVTLLLCVGSDLYRLPFMYRGYPDFKVLPDWFFLTSSSNLGYEFDPDMGLQERIQWFKEGKLAYYRYFVANTTVYIDKPPRDSYFAPPTSNNYIVIKIGSPFKSKRLPEELLDFSGVDYTFVYLDGKVDKYYYNYGPYEGDYSSDERVYGYDSELESYEEKTVNEMYTRAYPHPYVIIKKPTEPLTNDGGYIAFHGVGKGWHKVTSITHDTISYYWINIKDTKRGFTLPPPVPNDTLQQLQQLLRSLPPGRPIRRPIPLPPFPTQVNESVLDLKVSINGGPWLDGPITAKKGDSLLFNIKVALPYISYYSPAVISNRYGRRIPPYPNRLVGDIFLDTLEAPILKFIDLPKDVDVLNGGKTLRIPVNLHLNQSFNMTFSAKMTEDGNGTVCLSTSRINLKNFGGTFGRNTYLHDIIQINGGYQAIDGKRLPIPSTGSERDSYKPNHHAKQKIILPTVLSSSFQPIANPPSIICKEFIFIPDNAKECKLWFAYDTASYDSYTQYRYATSPQDATYLQNASFHLFPAFFNKYSNTNGSLKIFRQNISNLEKNTTYYIRGAISYNGSIIQTPEITIPIQDSKTKIHNKTIPPDLNISDIEQKHKKIIVTTGIATDIQDHSAVLSGYLNNLDGADYADVFFIYWNKNENRFPLANLHTAFQRKDTTSYFSDIAYCPKSGTTYHFRAAAILYYSDGYSIIVTGSVKTFKTSGSPPSTSDSYNGSSNANINDEYNSYDTRINQSNRFTTSPYSDNKSQVGNVVTPPTNNNKQSIYNDSNRSTNKQRDILPDSNLNNRINETQPNKVPIKNKTNNINTKTSYDDMPQRYNSKIKGFHIFLKKLLTKLLDNNSVLRQLLNT